MSDLTPQDIMEDAVYAAYSVKYREAECACRECMVETIPEYILTTLAEAGFEIVRKNES